jgi:hypothetical protein
MAQSTSAMRREVMADGRVVLADSIALVQPEDEGRVVVCGSHGGISSGEYAARVPPAAVFFNDAGGGKDDAGRAALPYLARLGIAAGTVSHDSAMIGVAAETWDSGIISAVNELAQAAGYAPGTALRDAVRAILRGSADAQ